MRALRRLLLAAMAVLLWQAVAWAAAPGPVSAQPAIGGRRVALVIGNGAYRQVDRLPNAAGDAKLIAATLQTLGFTLVGGGPLLELDRAHLAQAIQDFGHALAGADVGLFYYSGHGLQVQGVNWLVPVDANPTRVQDLDFQMVDADLVLRQMDGAGTRLNLMLLDACRNNPFAMRGLRSLQAGLAEMRAPQGTLISYATQPGNVAADGSGEHSPYTAALAEGMRQPGQDLFRMFNQVGLQVKRSTAGSQQPWVSSSPIDGDFSFAPAARPEPVAPPPPPQPPAQVAMAPAVPDPQESLLKGLSTQARSRSCAVLDVLRDGDAVRVAGLAVRGPDWDGFLRQVGATRGIRLATPDIVFLPAFACAALDVLSDAVRRGADGTGRRLLAVPQTRIAPGETLAVTLRQASGRRVLADLFRPDGTVQHLRIGPPAGEGGTTRLRIVLPDGADPAGPRLLAVVSSTASLGLEGRPAVEAASTYLAVLGPLLADAAVQADLASLDLASKRPAPPAASPSPAASRPARCGAITDRAQLGEPLSDDDRGFLRSQCR